MSRDRRSRRGRASRAAAAALGWTLLLAGGGPAAGQQEVVPPKPTVPEVFTLMGQFVRVAYNTQGFVTMGYQVAQRSVGEEWMMLEVGLTLRAPAKDITFKREHLSLKTPDGTVIALAGQRDFAEASYLPALKNRAKVVRDSINYFPVDVTRGCAIGFFADPTESPRRLAYDQVDLSYNRACVGRIYFRVPGGIKTGQHWLLVNFGDSEVQVPFRILTKEEEKQFRETWQDLKKAHEETYKR